MKWLLLLQIWSGLEIDAPIKMAETHIFGPYSYETCTHFAEKLRQADEHMRHVFAACVPGE